MKIRLNVQDGPKSYDFEHPGPSVAVGRNPAGDIILEAEAPESVVSWDHARIDLSAREATLTDLRSTNGTFRNGAPVTGTVPLWPEDAVRFGRTGPVLTVRMIDLSPVAPPPLAIPVGAKARVAKPQAAKPVVSETRGIALQAVQQLMGQQEQLKAQQAAHARQRRALAVTAAVAILLFLLLGGGLLWHSGKLDFLGRRVDDNTAEVAKLGEHMRTVAAENADHFAKIDADLTAQKAAQDQLMAKVDAAAKTVLDQEAKLRGGLDSLKHDLGLSLDDLNRRLAKANDKAAEKPAAKPAADMRVVAKPADKPADKPAPRVEPGMKVAVIMRQGMFYTGVLLGIEGTEVRLFTNPNPGAKPTVVDIKDVQAFQTRDGVYALNPSTGEFESAMAYYRFNRGTDLFERTGESHDISLAQDAEVIGPVNAVKAVLAVGHGGEWVLGLPLPASQAPASIPAYQFKEIVTAKGVYTYDSSKQDFSYKSHADLAAAAREARDEFWRKDEEKWYKRRKESYQMATDRLKALAPYYWRRWWWW
jgi:pSer/pThr/pTyr-binding forkhead associated (FHA) protein